MTRDRLKVAMVTPRYAPAMGGIERMVEMVTQGLVRRGVHVEVITTDPTGRLRPVEMIDGAIVRRFRTLGNDSVYYLSPGLGLWLLQHAAEFDVVHGHSYHTPVALQAAVASWRAGVPLVVTSHFHGTGHSRL